MLLRMALFFLNYPVRISQKSCRATLSPVIVQGTLGVATTILNVAGMSFLGLGIQPPAPEWGSILSSARMYMRDAWHISLFPGLAIVICILSLNLLGDGLRDALDPKQKR